MNKTKSEPVTAAIEAQESVVESNEESATTKPNLVVSKYAHQITLLIFINALFIIFEIVNAFQHEWLSAVIYGVISLSSIGYIWTQKESAKFLILIPFVSLLVASILIDFPILITIIYGVNCLFFFIIAIIKKNTIDAIVTTITTGLMLVTLTSLSLINRGFVKTNTEVNAIAGITLLWLICTTVTTIMFSKELWQKITYILSSQLIFAVLPFVRPEGTNSNVFTLICVLGFLVSAITTLILVTKNEELDDFYILITVCIVQVGIIILSYSFNIGLNWLGSEDKVLIVDYALHIPLAIFALVNYLITFYKAKQQQSGLPDAQEKYQQLKPFILYGSFVISSLAMAGWVYDYLNLINVLVLSVLFFGVSIAINRIVLALVSLIMTYAFVGFTMGFVGSAVLDIILIVMMGIAGLLLIFSIINEKWIHGEPLTSALSLSSSLIILVNLLIVLDFTSYFVILGWIAIGFYLFAIGIFFNKILWRRIGLGVILLTLVFTTIIVSISGMRGIFIGIILMVVAIVLFVCIMLFRWSEKREKQLDEEEAEEQPPTEEEEVAAVKQEAAVMKEAFGEE